MLTSTDTHYYGVDVETTNPTTPAPETPMFIFAALVTLATFGLTRLLVD